MTNLEQLDQAQAKSAIVALYEYSRSKESDDLLASEEPDLFMQVTTKVIPPLKATKSAGGKKIKAKHSLYPSNANVCVFVKSDGEKTQEEINKNDLKNVKIIDMDQLKASYSTFERRRRLADSYDVFFVDDRIVTFMPKLLGTVFLKRTTKTPIPVNFAVKNKANALKNALCTQLYKASAGTTFTVRIGHLGLSEDEALENLTAVVESLCKAAVAPENIQELSLKLEKSPALPFYNSLPEH